MKGYCVYEHVFPDGKRYVGLSKAPAERRWKSDGSGYIGNKEMYHEIEKFGWNNIKHDILAEGLTRTEAQQTEREFIEKHDTIRNGFNKNPGGTIGGCLYSQHVMKMIRLLKRLSFLNKDYLPTAEKLLALSDNEGWAYQLNLVDYVMRTECDGYKNGIANRLNDMQYEVIDWYYYLSHWITEPETDIRAIHGPIKSFEEIRKQINEGRFEYE